VEEASVPERLSCLPVGFGAIFLALLFWSLVFYAPYAWAVMSFSCANGQLPGLFLHGCTQFFSGGEEEWKMLWEKCKPFLASYIITTPWVLVGSIAVSRHEHESVLQRYHHTEDKLHNALRTRLIAGLLLSVAGAELPAGPYRGFVDTTKGEGGGKWAGTSCEHKGLLYFSPENAKEILVLYPEDRSVSFIDTTKGEGGGTWAGACEHKGSLYFCPRAPKEILVLQHMSSDAGLTEHLQLHQQGYSVA